MNIGKIDNIGNIGNIIDSRKFFLLESYSDKIFQKVIQKEFFFYKVFQDTFFFNHFFCANLAN